MKSEIKRGTLLRSKLFNDGVVVQCTDIDDKLVWLRGQLKGDTPWTIKREEMVNTQWAICGFKEIE